MIIKITVLIPRPCLSPTDSWCSSVEAAWPEEHLQGRKFFLDFAGGKLQKALEVGPRGAPGRKGSNPERGNLCADISY